MPNPSELERQHVGRLANPPVALLPGNTLPNGAEILAVHLTKDGGLVLAKRLRTREIDQPYVSWRLSPNLDPRSTYAGSYHTTLDGARFTYLERLAEYSSITE